MRLTRPSLFQNVQLKLSTVHAITIFCLFIIYNVISHWYFEHRVYENIDATMQFEINGFYRAHQGSQLHSTRLPRASCQ